MASSGLFTAIYEVVKMIPRGKVATYGQIAALAGNPRAAREVGWALHVNKDPENIPCHRVVNRNGCLSKAFAFGGVEEHMRRLLAEGIIVREDKTVNLEEYRM